MTAAARSLSPFVSPSPFKRAVEPKRSGIMIRVSDTAAPVPRSCLAARPSVSRGNIRGNIQIVRCVHSVQNPGRSGHIGRIGRF